MQLYCQKISQDHLVNYGARMDSQKSSENRTDNLKIFDFRSTSGQIFRTRISKATKIL